MSRDGVSRKTSRKVATVPSTFLSQFNQPASFSSRSVEMRVEAAVWQALATTQVNAVIVGDPRGISRALMMLWPTLRKPVYHCGGERLVLPPAPSGTVIVERADELTPANQQLLDWWLAEAPSVRVIATAAPTLF